MGNGLLTASRVSGRNANIMLIEAPESVPINEMIDTAVFSGADVVVGPLQKDQVEQLSREKNLPIPIVTLNYAATPDEEISPNMLMLSVATDLEAEYIARQAVRRCLKRQPQACPRRCSSSRRTSRGKSA